MKKAFVSKKTLFFQIVLVFLCIPYDLWAQYTSNSPYAIFGDSSKMLEPTKDSPCDLYSIKILSKDGAIYIANFNLKNNIATLSNLDGKIIFQDCISEDSKARFMTIDPHAENYHNLSPYSYCGNSPICNIDPNGMDWYQNNQNSYYTWYDGDKERKGFTHIGGKGSVLGEFENIIDNILCGKDGLGLKSLYSNGFSFDIAPNNKGGLIGSKERGWDFFDEFINGSGPEFSVILENHPYTQAIMNDDFIKASQNIIKSRGNNGKYTNAGRPEFFPWQASPLSPMQFIGTYRYDGYSSKDGHYINNVVTDSKSVTSLGYHIPFLKNHRRGQNRILGNTYQFYIWRIKK